MGITHGDATATMKARKMTERCQDGGDGWGEGRIGWSKVLFIEFLFFRVERTKSSEEAAEEYDFLVVEEKLSSSFALLLWPTFF